MIHVFYITALVLVILIFIAVLNHVDAKHIKQCSNLNENYNKQVESQIRLALDKSRNTIRGSVSEEIVSVLPGFPYNASDCKFLGQPFDYIVFNNMSATRDTNDTTDEIEIVFVDVKKNTSRLSRIQNKIKKAIVEKRVRFETWHINEDYNLKVKQ